MKSVPYLRSFATLLLTATAGLSAWPAAAQSPSYRVYVGEFTTSTAPADVLNSILFNYQSPANSGPDSVRASYAPAPNTINGVSGSYTVSATSDTTHGGTVRATAFGDGAFGDYKVRAVGDTTPMGFVESDAYQSYFFQLVGPSTTGPVNVYLETEFSIVTVGSGIANVLLDISSSVDHPFNFFEALGGGDADSSRGPYTTGILLRPNVTYQLRAEVHAWSHSPQAQDPTSRNYDPRLDRSSGAAEAYLDPVFTLDPSQAALYHFVGLPAGADGTISTVPEPSVLALFSMGLCGLAAVRVRSRNAG